MQIAITTQNELKRRVCDTRDLILGLLFFFGSDCILCHIDFCLHNKGGHEEWVDKVHAHFAAELLQLKCNTKSAHSCCLRRHLTALFV